MQVWEGYVPEVARATANGDAEEAIPSSSGQVSVTVTEMADANTIYIQVHHIDTLLCGAPPVEFNGLQGARGRFDAGRFLIVVKLLIRGRESIQS